MKSVKIDLAGQVYYLAFNGSAMFAFEDAFGGTSGYFDLAGEPGRAGLEAVCQAAVILAEQGELARRALGYDRGPMADRERLLTVCSPADTLALRQAVLAAITAGYGREVESEEDVDLCLIELEQKKTTG